MLAKLKYPALTFLISFSILFFFYHEVILSPNDYLFSAAGDGSKNYYAFLYHAQIDSSFWNFEGMNYPFGENIVYADAHPLFSWLIGLFGLGDYGVGILNMAMLLSFPLCSVILFLLFRHYKLSISWSIAAAIAMTLMAPQIYRITGHFAMSYLFAIPLMWYFLIKSSHSKRSWVWSIITCLYLLGFFFTHPYLGLIMAFFAGVYWVVRMVVERKEKGRWLKIAGTIGLQVFLPLVLFQLLILMNDTHLDRPNNPAGFFFYHGNWKSFLVAHDGPLNSVIQFFGIKLAKWESWNYIGLSTMIFGAVAIFWAWKKKKQLYFKQILGSELFSFFIAAYLILLFSFCFPFKFEFMHWFVDLFGPLKQFRVLGRFGWIFFYVGVVFTIVLLSRIKDRSEKPLRFELLFYAGIVFYLIEAYPVHNRLKEVVSTQKNEFRSEFLSEAQQEVIDHIESEQYDAILFLPFQHMSSENIMILGKEGALHDACVLSYHTKTPLLNSLTSRMSLSESEQFNNFFSPEFVDKELCTSIGYDKKICLVKNNEALNINELRMLWASDKILENEEYKVFDFQLNQWNDPTYYEAVIAEKDSARFKKNGWSSVEKNPWFAYESFDTFEAVKILGGSGALQGEKESITVIYSMDAEGVSPGTYLASFWFYYPIDRPDITAYAELLYADDEASSWESGYDIFASNHIVNGWCHVSLEFRIKQNTKTVNILLTGNGSRKPYIVDELLIRPANGPNLFREINYQGERYLNYNNHLLPADSFQD